MSVISNPFVEKVVVCLKLSGASVITNVFKRHVTLKNKDNRTINIFET